MHKNIVKLLLIVATCFIAINSLPVYATDQINPKGSSTIPNAYTDSGSEQRTAERKKQAQDKRNVTTEADKEFGCGNPNIKRAVGVVAEALLWLRIIVPIIIVLVGSINFAKAVISQDDNDIREVFYALMKKILIGVLIFVLPTIIIVSIKTIVRGYSSDSASWTICVDLLK